MKKWLLAILIGLLVIASIILVGLFLEKEFFQTPKKELTSSAKLETKLQTTILEVKRYKVDNNLSVATEIEDYVNSQKIPKKELPKKKSITKPSCKIKTTSKKVYKKVFNDGVIRLAIIMDDIGSLEHVQNLENIPYAITPSIFPSTSKHPSTPQLAKRFKHYMVHMPMEAFNFARPEIGTLSVKDSQSTLEKKIREMHKDFPDAIAINNHTGSKFTSDEEAMDKLFCVLDKYDIRFIDSKTSVHTKGKKIGKVHNKIVLQRDVFLDNKPDVDYIIGQIQQAIKVAKRNGVAIAICHPRVETFQALQEAEYLFEGVKLIYIDELY